MTYDLGLHAVCADFKENIDFQFSLGWTALVTRFIGAANARQALSGERTLKVTTDPLEPLVLSSSNEETLLCLQEGSTFKDKMVVSIATRLVSITSRASMAVLVIGGVVGPNQARR